MIIAIVLYLKHLDTLKLMRNLTAIRGLTLVEALITLIIIAALASIAIPNYSLAKKKHDAEEAILKNEIGNPAELLFVSIGKQGQETFYYLVPEEKDSRVIYPLNQSETRPFATAPVGYKIVKVRSNKVLEKSTKVSLEAQ